MVWKLQYIVSISSVSGCMEGGCGEDVGRLVGWLWVGLLFDEAGVAEFLYGFLEACGRGLVVAVGDGDSFCLDIDVEVFDTFLEGDIGFDFLFALIAV